MATPPHPNKHPSVNHTNPHTSLLLCEALSHILSLLTVLAAKSALYWIRVFTQPTDPWSAAQWRGVWGNEVNEIKRILPFSVNLRHSIFPSLSLSLISHLSITFPFPFSLSLSFVTDMLLPTLPIHAEVVNQRSTYTLKCMSGISEWEKGLKESCHVCLK